MLRLDRNAWFDLSETLSALYLLGALIYWGLSWFFEMPYASTIALFAIAPLLYLCISDNFNKSHIDIILKRELKDASKFVVLTRDFPNYRFVDLFRSIDSLQERYTLVRNLEAQNAYSLNDILHGTVHADHRKCTKPESHPYNVDVQKESFFPSDGFRIHNVDFEGENNLVIVRLKREEYAPYRLNLEIASPSVELSTSILEAIVDSAKKHSIYRNHSLEVRFEANVDTSGDVEQGEGFTISFLQRTEITDDDIILEPAVKQLIRRNILDFHNRRDEYMGIGIPSKKGVLLYGPPGTGKTYTCKFVAGQLPTATTIFAVGSALLHMKSVCNIARMLQPSIIVLEDVDLVFSSREINPYVTALGTLLDEMDGISSEDALIFILTTNEIDRVEEAVKDRPGRISQCIHVKEPGPDLRLKYLKNLMVNYISTDVDLSELVKNTEGASQAFIKGFVFRAVQISLDDGLSQNGSVKLQNDHFHIALSEMTTDAGKHGMSILGFGR